MKLTEDSNCSHISDTILIYEPKNLSKVADCENKLSELFPPIVTIFKIKSFILHLQLVELNFIPHQCAKKICNINSLLVSLGGP